MTGQATVKSIQGQSEMDFVRDRHATVSIGRYGRYIHPTDTALRNVQADLSRHDQTRPEQTRHGMASSTNLGKAYSVYKAYGQSVHPRYSLVRVSRKSRFPFLNGPGGAGLGRSLGVLQVPVPEFCMYQAVTVYTRTWLYSHGRLYTVMYTVYTFYTSKELQLLRLLRLFMYVVGISTWFD